MKLSASVLLLVVCCAALASALPVGDNKAMLESKPFMEEKPLEKFESKPIVDEVNPVFVGSSNLDNKEAKFDQKPILEDKPLVDNKFDDKFVEQKPDKEKFVEKFDDKFEEKPIKQQPQQQQQQQQLTEDKLVDEQKFEQKFEQKPIVGGEGDKDTTEKEMPMLADRLEQARTSGSFIKPLLPLSTAAVTAHPMLSSKTAKLVAQHMPAAPEAIVKPKNAPVLATELPINTQWSFVQQPISQKRQNLATIELAPIMQPYTVSSTTFKQENIKQPITEPVYQPYLQRYMQQAHPVVQPIVQRVVQPVVHRELHSYLQTKSGQAPDAETIIKPTEFTSNTNQAIRGSDLQALPISKTVGPQ